MKNKHEQLMESIKTGKVNRALKLIKDGVDINAVNYKGQTALAWAANYNHSALVKKLLEKGALVDSRDQWQLTPLMNAANNNSLEIMELLLKNGADIHAKNKYNKTPILFAAGSGTVETIQFMLNQGANIDDADITGVTVLMLAVSGLTQRVDLVKFVLANCTNKLQVDETGKNALDYAKEFGHKKIVNILKKAGLKPADAAKLKRLKANKEIFLIKRSSCPVCGAPKATVSATAYIYCDYCASFMDWDYRLAMEKSATITTEKRYSFAKSVEKILIDISRILENFMAGKKANADKYGEYMKRYTAKHMKMFPYSYSPRIADQEYRNNYLEYTRLSYREILLNRDLIKLLKQQNKRQNDINWVGAKVESVSFHKYFEATNKYLKAACATLENRGILEKHPDYMNAELAYQLSLSYFLEQWLHFLSQEDLEKILTVCYLKDEYVAAKPVKLDLRHCGGCGNELKVVAKAQKTLCRSCGKIIDVKQHEFACPACSNLFSFPLNKSHIKCTACGAMISSLPDPAG